MNSNTQVGDIEHLGLGWHMSESDGNIDKLCVIVMQTSC